MRPAQDGDVLGRVVQDTSWIEGAGPPSPSKRPWYQITIPILLAVLVADLWSKNWAENSLRLGPCSATPDACRDVVWTLRFHLVENPGIAFSKGLGAGRLVGTFGLAMAVFLINLARKSTSPWWQAMIGLMAGGVLGNIANRIFRATDGFMSGSVVDFIDLQWWPVWNVADAALSCGVAGLLLHGLWSGRESPADGESERADSAVLGSTDDG